MISSCDCHATPNANLSTVCDCRMFVLVVIAFAPAPPTQPPQPAPLSVRSGSVLSCRSTQGCAQLQPGVGQHQSGSCSGCTELAIGFLAGSAAEFVQYQQCHHGAESSTYFEACNILVVTIRPDPFVPSPLVVPSVAQANALVAAINAKSVAAITTLFTSASTAFQNK